METHDERDARAGRPPRYTSADDAAPLPGSDMTARRKVRIAVIAVIVIALLAVMLVLHLTGVVGAGTNG